MMSSLQLRFDKVECGWWLTRVMTQLRIDEVECRVGGVDTNIHPITVDEVKYGCCSMRIWTPLVPPVVAKDLRLVITDADHGSWTVGAFD